MTQTDKRKLLNEFQSRQDRYKMLEQAAVARLGDEIERAGIRILALHHRIKTKQSLSGKIDKCEEQIQALSDIRDLVGLRVITFFGDDVDKIGRIVERIFQVDAQHSKDKRQMIQATAFGYLSLHYICSLKEDEGGAGLCGMQFEIQIRTGLQHIWAEIEHDIGYKSKFGVSRDIRRSFSRVAGLLEVADDEFLRIRDGMKNYVDDIREKIRQDAAFDLTLNAISLAEYLQFSAKAHGLMQRFSEACKAELIEVGPEAYVEQLHWLGKKTLGDLGQMIDHNEEQALRLAREDFIGSELDICSTNAVLRYLCRAELLNGGYTHEQVTEYMLLFNPDEAKAKKQADTLRQKIGEQV